MFEYEGQKTTPTSSKIKQKNPIAPTSVESLLFFNVVRFGSSLDHVDWVQVAAHSNLKNAASAKTRFRQIMKKYESGDGASSKPRQQSLKRKASLPTTSCKGDDSEDDNSYLSPKPNRKAGVRNRPADDHDTGGNKRPKVAPAVKVDSEDVTAGDPDVGLSPAQRMQQKKIKTEDCPGHKAPSIIIPSPEDRAWVMYDHQLTSQQQRHIAAMRADETKQQEIQRQMTPQQHQQLKRQARFARTQALQQHHEAHCQEHDGCLDGF